MKWTVYTFLDVRVSFMDARSNFWKYVLLAQSYRFFVDEKLSLRFVNLWKNFLNHTISYAVAQLLFSRDSRKRIFMHLVSELYFYFAFAFYFSGSNNIKCLPPPPNPKSGPPYCLFWGMAIQSGPVCCSDLTSPLLPTEQVAHSIFCPPKHVVHDPDTLLARQHYNHFLTPSAHFLDWELFWHGCLIFVPLYPRA